VAKHLKNKLFSGNYFMVKQTHPKQQTLNSFMVSEHNDSRQPQCQAPCPSPLNPTTQSQILTPSNHIQIKLTKDN
jgi:hypothetical protein